MHRNVNQQLKLFFIFLLCIASVCACGKKEADGKDANEATLRGARWLREKINSRPQKADTASDSAAPVGGSDSDTAAMEMPSPVETLSQMLQTPLMIRYNTPGHVRYSMLFDAPISAISWSAHAGMSVSSGNYLQNVTTKGEQRWKLNAGEGHKVFVTGGEEIIWSGQFESVFQMKRNGRVGWKKPWAHPLAFNPPDSLFMVDASNVARLGADGHERWRVTVDDVRKLDGPFPCGNQVLFQGKRGQKSVATVVTDSGAVLNETELPFAAVVLGASFTCEPIIWSSGQVSQVGGRGELKWSYPLKNRPLFFKLFNTYLFIVPEPQESVAVVMVDKVGTILYKRGLPIAGRVTDGTVIELSGMRQAIALCKDVSSPCARRDGNRGPFNVLLTGDRGQFSVVERLVKGHNNIARFFNEGFVYAGSSTEDETTVTMYDRSAKIIWNTVLPGRLSAGPWVGPYGGVYLGTCMGWECSKPYRFISMTGAPEETGKDSD
ncbi:MAG: hypothetical protein JXR76_25440 [Deltaproteobacteria bacterium]|nr:hypothetical protein [Deltaproteobacteria bacterium]